MKSDGTPWRPLVHIEDISRAFLADAGGAARAGAQRGLQRRRGRARTTRSGTSPRSSSDVVPDSRVALRRGRQPGQALLPGELRQDSRALPEFQPEWDVRRGAEEMYRGLPRRRPDHRRLRELALHAHPALKELIDGEPTSTPRCAGASPSRRVSARRSSSRGSSSAYQRQVASSPRSRSHSARQPSSSRIAEESSHCRVELAVRRALALDVRLDVRPRRSSISVPHEVDHRHRLADARVPGAAAVGGSRQRVGHRHVGAARRPRRRGSRARMRRPSGCTGPLAVEQRRAPCRESGG